MEPDLTIIESENNDALSSQLLLVEVFSSR